MIKKPFFSIVIPTYNRAEDLRLALYCILKQEFSDYEVIISDNCSTDNTKEVIKNFKNKKIRYFCNKKNVEMVQNQKKAVDHAIGQYVFIHSDDDFLPFSDTLTKIQSAISKYQPGFIRLNYVSLSLDKKRVFNYRVNKPFKKNQYLKPLMDNKKILSFIIDSDPYFITGIIFKNKLPPTVKMIDTDPVPWIDILFFSTKQFGAYFMVEPQIVACWSRRKVKKNAQHHLFKLDEGKLKSENYFHALKEKLPIDDYKRFLHKELIIIYIGLLPAIKANVGNQKMLQICKRVRILDPSMIKSFIYWINLIPAFLFPKEILLILKDMYLYLYTILSKTDDQRTLERLRLLEREYLSESNKNNRIFNF